jgi:hypothetical protein
MQVYELKDPKIMGEEHPQYGFTFWSETDGDYPVMFNSKQGNIMPGTRVTAESIEHKTSAKGKEYIRLKKVKFEDSPEQTQAFEKKPAPTFGNSPEQTTKESLITRSMVWKALIDSEDVQSLTPNSPRWTAFWATVELHTEMLTNGNYDKLIGGSLSASSGATNDSDAVPTPSSSATPSLKASWEKTQSNKAVSYDDPPESENG